MSSHASAYDLQRFAWKRLAAARAVGNAKPTKEALDSLNVVIRDFVADNGPTPQVGSTARGSVELQWLAGGTLVSALFDQTGEYNLYAVAPDENVLFDTDIALGESIPDDIRIEMSAVLGKMSALVTARPASWH